MPWVGLVFLKRNKQITIKLSIKSRGGGSKMWIVVSLCIEFITQRYFIDSGSEAVTQAVCTCVRVSVCSNQPLTCLRAGLQRQHLAS